MKATQNKLLKKFYKKIKQGIPYNYPNRQKILQSFFSNLEDFASTKTELSYTDLENEFGTVEEIITSLFSELSADTIKKTYQQKRFLRHSFLCLFILLVLSIVHIIYQGQSNDIYYIEKTIYIYEETTETY